MKKFFGLLCALSLFLSLPGCGDSGPTNVAEGVGQSELDAHEAMVKEETKVAEDIVSDFKPEP